MQNSTLELMKKHKVPMTRENYLYLEYMGTPPEEIGGEIEAEIPQEIRDAEDAADIAWMAELGVGWVPENDDDED